MVPPHTRAPPLRLDGVTVNRAGFTDRSVAVRGPARYCQHERLYRPGSKSTKALTDIGAAEQHVIHLHRPAEQLHNSIL
ncbi:hypothetical protein F2P81_006552 [Scophthalmus maximus]|uniref:Uncharacterized protein n=1 Tax=Scophthalmus maximus TaxID=52904 RepID=A0A6A4TBV1_SCOMX|nr:hypothetical protein F2P81_006552 [Scophthalmus maximus]